MLPRGNITDRNNIRINGMPEFGHVAGGLFNFTARSGTNQLHGSAYGYFVNEALHAGRPFATNGDGEHLRPRIESSITAPVSAVQ